MIRRDQADPENVSRLVTRYTSGYYEGRGAGLYYAPRSSSDSTSGVGRRRGHVVAAGRPGNALKFRIGGRSQKE